LQHCRYSNNSSKLLHCQLGIVVFVNCRSHCFNITAALFVDIDCLGFF
jgi:hypothetical protein